MCNCVDEECLNLVINNTIDDTRCKVLDIENPEDNSIISCEYFKQSKTCRLCENSKLIFWVYDDPLDFEEDYECTLDSRIKTSYFTIEQSNSDYQCQSGKFKYFMGN